LDAYDAPDEPRRKVKEWAMGYAASFPEHRKTGKSAILIGRPGTGKTHLACAVARAVADRGFSARYTTVSGAIRRIKDSWRKESEESEVTVINDYGGCDLLVLDEVGVQNGSQFESNILFDLLNRRYEHMLPTVLVSNLPIAEVTTLLGERVIDRLREGGGQMLAFGWESHRRKT
jgi:DNA replication protein DnaC